jgi:hypothetical protein
MAQSLPAVNVFGNAGRRKSGVPAGETVVIEATATDHHGHTGMKRVDPACGPRVTQN